MKPKQFFFVVLGGLLVVVGAGGYGYTYGLKFVRAQSNNLAAQLAEQKVADEQLDSLKRLDAKYTKDILPILSLINEALPQNKRQSEILAQIQRVGASNGMSLTSVNLPGPTGLPSDVSQTTKTGTVLALPINFYVEGTYGQLENFTRQLESLNRFTNITALSVERKAPIAKYTFTLNAYIKP